MIRAFQTKSRRSSPLRSFTAPVRRSEGAVATLRPEPAIPLQRKCACGGGCPQCKKKGAGSSDDAAEREADRVADQVVKSDKNKPFAHDVKAARYRAGIAARRIINHGLVSKENRQQMNRELEYFEGAAWEAYVEGIRPALKAVTEIEMPTMDLSRPLPIPSISLGILSSGQMCPGGCFDDAKVSEEFGDMEQRDADELAKKNQTAKDQLSSMTKDWRPEYQTLAQSLLAPILDRNVNPDPRGVSDFIRQPLLDRYRAWLHAVDDARLKTCDPDRGAIDTARATASNDDPCKSWFKDEYSHGPTSLQELEHRLSLNRLDSFLPAAETVYWDVFELRKRTDPDMLKSEHDAAMLVNFLVGLAGLADTIANARRIPAQVPPVRPSGPSPTVVQGSGQGNSIPTANLGIVTEEGVIVPARPAPRDVQLPSRPTANDNAPTGAQSQQMAKTGTGPSGTGTKPPPTTYTPRNRSRFDDPYERGRRPTPPSRDPSMSEHTDELDEANQSHETVTSKKKKDRPLSERQIHSEAGDAIEASVVQQWEKTQPATTKVYPTGKLPESIDRLYPKGPQGRGGPDAVAIDVANKRIVVFDSAPTQNAEHVAKTYRDADTLKNNLPPEYSGFDVFSQEGWYTGGIRFSAVKKH